MSAVSPAPTFVWKQAFVVLVFVELALLALYFGTARAMVEIWWRSETFNHAFLVPPISLWLIWDRRHALTQIAPRPAFWMTLPMAGAAFAWLLGELAAVNAVTQFAFVALLVLAVPLVIGPKAAQRIAFPLGFLFFAVPFGEFVMPQLMEWTAKFTVLGLRASGIPVYQEGLHFVIPSGRWSVVEACSGVRYLIASVVVGTLYAYLNYRSLKRRLIFVGIAIAVPLVANWVRAYLIVMIGHLSGNELAVGADHLIYGWLFFGIVILIMFAIGMRWQEAPPVFGKPAAGSVPLDAASPSRIWASGLSALIIAVAPYAVLHRLEGASELPAPELSAASLARGGWQVEESALTDWQPAFTNPSATLNVTLAKEGKRVGVFIAWYQQQNYQRKLISSENVLVKSSDKNWAQIARGMQAVSLGGQQVHLRSGVIRRIDSGLTSEAPRFHVWYWYRIDGRNIGSDALGKAWLALMRLSGRGDASAAVFVHAPEPGAEEVLSRYLVEAGAGIEHLLDSASAVHP